MECKNSLKIWLNFKIIKQKIDKNNLKRWLNFKVVKIVQINNLKFKVVKILECKEIIN